MYKPEQEPVFFSQAERFERMLQGHRIKILSVIEHLIERGDRQVGKGKTAEVHYAGTNNGVCIKIINKKTIQEDAQFFHSIKQEAWLHDEAFKISDRVRVPKPYLSWILQDDNGDNVEIFVMEKLPAITLDSIINGDESVPANFDIRNFFELLREFIQKLHDAGIYHRDLHAGNVMVDIETGDPYVIDFGSSIKALGDEDPYAQYLPDGSIFKFRTDESSILRLKKELTASLT